MKIVVFCDKNYINILPRFVRLFKTLMIEPHFYSMNKRWNLRKESSLLKSLSKSDEYLIIGDSASINDPWLIYIMGIVRAQNKKVRRIIFYLNGNTRKLPGWMKEFPIAKSIPDLYEVWSNNLKDWNRQADVAIASKRIKEMGFSLTKGDFFTAASEGDLFLFSLYLEAGFDPNSEDKEGVPILCHAIRLGYLSYIPRLLFWGIDINRKAHDRANTAIMEAASKGLTDVVQLLINHGAELDHQSKSGQTALILAVGNGQTQVARILMKAGADIRAKDPLGMDARKYANLYNYTDLLELMDHLYGKE
ncbi:MAG: ankyrin repeat domain-containing protein [Spirochaetaceae bacterium]|jgi:hypothetical protein|nr:ankyrin repeat domain-containing protein [Spirochaetaceae bacterium]